MRQRRRRRFHAMITALSPFTIRFRRRYADADATLSRLRAIAAFAGYAAIAYYAIIAAIMLRRFR